MLRWWGVGERHGGEEGRVGAKPPKTSLGVRTGNGHGATRYPRVDVTRKQFAIRFAQPFSPHHTHHALVPFRIFGDLNRDVVGERIVQVEGIARVRVNGPPRVVVIGGKLSARGGARGDVGRGGRCLFAGGGRSGPLNSAGDFRRALAGRGRRVFGSALSQRGEFLGAVHRYRWGRMF